MIREITTEQENLISVYREKWRNIALSTERIERETASEVIERAYALVGKKKPKIIFCDSPHDYALKVSEFLSNSEPPDFVQAMGRLNEVLGEYFQELGSQIKNALEEGSNPSTEQFETPLPWSEEQLKQEFPQFQPHSELGENLDLEYNNDLMDSLERQVPRKLQKKIFKLFGNLDDVFNCQLRNLIDDRLNALPNSRKLWTVIHNCISYDALAGNYVWFDFYISVLACKVPLDKWQVSLDLLQKCGYIYPFEHICFICDRPLKIMLDEKGQFHAEGEPAIVFADNFSIYAYRGTPLQGKYIETHPRDWQSEWYLEETKSDLRRALLEALPQDALQPWWLLQEYELENRQRLIQRIGVERICEELQAEEIDAWQNSVLLRIEAHQSEQVRVDDNEQDEEEPIILLKTISEIGHVQVTCVDSCITTVEEALEWLSYETELIE